MNSIITNNIANNIANNEITSKSINKKNKLKRNNKLADDKIIYNPNNIISLYNMSEIRENIYKKVYKKEKNYFFHVLMTHALCDTIGFKNGDWEFNYNDMLKAEILDYVNELIYEFIDLGGINGLNIKSWLVSDDTFFHIAMAKSMLEYKNKLNEKFILKVKTNLLKEAKHIWKELSGDTTKLENYKKMNGKNRIIRYIGETTSESIKQFTTKHDARKDNYDQLSGGNGCAMRNIVIGLCLHGENIRDELIDISIITSKLTHNNAHGYLAGFVSALFAALAMEGVPIEKWVFIMIEYLRSNKIKKFLSIDNVDEIFDYNLFVKYWQKYIDTKFDKNSKPIRNRSFANPMHRIRYFHENFHKETPSYQIGSSGYLCMIMAYDALLDCDGHFEKLVVYSILHSGDSDTIGSVAGGLYGAVYGFGDIPPYLFEHIERKREIIDLSNKLYDKYNS